MQHNDKFAIAISNLIFVNTVTCNSYLSIIEKVVAKKASLTRKIYIIKTKSFNFIGFYAKNQIDLATNWFWETKKEKYFHIMQRSENFDWISTYFGLAIVFNAIVRKKKLNKVKYGFLYLNKVKTLILLYF